MTSQFIIGDIIIGTKRTKKTALHPIIFIAKIDSFYFEGVMLTHSKEFDNILLKDEHFEVMVTGNGKPSYFVNSYLIKENEWGPYTKIGKLSGKGIHLIKSKLAGKIPVQWSFYLKRNP
jgi:hypothetical protein